MGRFFESIGRFFSFLFLRRSEDIRKAADEQFTGSVTGIRAAFAIERDALAKDFRELQEAVAGVLNVVEDRKAQLQDLAEEEKQVSARLEGALVAAEKAQASGNAEELTQAKAAYERYKARITEIDASEERLTAQVTDLENSLQKHMLRLTDLKARLGQLTAQEAEAVAEFVSAREITELNNRLMNAQDSLRESPVASVMERVREMSAQARITEKLVGTDARLQDQQYERLGQSSLAGDDFEAVLAARREQREGAPQTEKAAPEKATLEQPTPERPQL
jgi:chromosome segregation ATPase